MMLYVVCFIAGYLISFMIYTRVNDVREEHAYKMQQKRGDYWFTRYLQACDMLQQHNEYLPNEEPKSFYDH